MLSVRSVAAIDGPGRFQATPNQKKDRQELRQGLAVKTLDEGFYPPINVDITNRKDPPFLYIGKTDELSTGPF